MPVSRTVVCSYFIIPCCRLLDQRLIHHFVTFSRLYKTTRCSLFLHIFALLVRIFNWILQSFHIEQLNLFVQVSSVAACWDLNSSCHYPALHPLFLPFHLWPTVERTLLTAPKQPFYIPRPHLSQLDWVIFLLASQCITQNERRKTLALDCCCGTRGVWRVESSLVFRSSSLSAVACSALLSGCNGLLKMVREIRRHTILQHWVPQCGLVQTNTTVFIVIVTHRTPALDISSESISALQISPVKASFDFRNELMSQ